MNKGCSQKKPIDCLTNNIIERLKVGSIETSLDNLMCVSNPRNSTFDELRFHGDERLITRRLMYHINDDILERLNNGLFVGVCMNQM